MKEEEFFSSYAKVNKETGIPGLQMNHPIGVQSQFTGKIGLELEIEAARSLPRDGHLSSWKAKNGGMWMSVTDGSLRGEAREYILTQPIDPEDVRPATDYLFGVFRDLKSSVNNSNRCSTHVHINMRGRKVNEVTTAIALWGIFEEALIDWCGEGRKTNHFALSSKDASTMIREWDRYLTAGAINPGRNLKYSALNIEPLFSRGSLEVRCGSAANDPETPALWATFLENFFSKGMERFVNPAEIAYSFSEQGSAELFDSLCNSPRFQERVIDACGGVSAFNDKALNGFRNIQSLILGYPWDRWMEMINRVYVPNPFGKKKSTLERPIFDDVAEPPRWERLQEEQAIRAQRAQPGTRPAPTIMPDEETRRALNRWEREREDELIRQRAREIQDRMDREALNHGEAIARRAQELRQARGEMGMHLNQRFDGARWVDVNGRPVDFN